MPKVYWMEEILHQLVDGNCSHVNYLQIFTVFHRNPDSYQLAQDGLSIHSMSTLFSYNVAPLPQLCLLV